MPADEQVSSLAPVVEADADDPGDLDPDGTGTVTPSDAPEA